MSALRPLHAVALGLFALCVGSCAKQAPDGLTSSALELASMGDVRSLDPAALSDGLAPVLTQMLYAGLVDYDEHGELRPDLAERYERSPDGLRFRFELRRGVRLHDGNELTAADCKRSIERALGPDAPNPMRGLVASIAGFDAFTRGDEPHLSGVEVESEYVLTFRLSEPNATFERALPLHMLRPVCRTMGARYQADAEPCGAGPFRLVRWDRGVDVRLQRVAGEAPLQVHFSFRMSPLTQRFRFERGELDVLAELGAADERRVSSEPQMAGRLHRLPATQMSAEGMNTTFPPFDNVHIRRAVSFAIDRDQYVQLRPHALTPLTQPVPPGVYGHHPGLACQRFDRDAALREMALAGYPFDPRTGQGGYPHPIPYLAYRRGLTELTAQLLQQQLAQIGLRLELRMVSYASYLAIAQRRDGSPMSFQGWSMDLSDPSNFTETLFHSRGIDDDGGGSNSAFYRNPALDQLLDRAKRETDASARLALYDRAQQIVCDDAPWAFTYALSPTLLWSARLHGARPHPMWRYDLRGAWLAPEHTP